MIYVKRISFGIVALIVATIVYIPVAAFVFNQEISDATGRGSRYKRRCAECEQIVTEMRAAFLKLMSTKPRGDVLYLSRLFLSEADLTRLKEQWQQSGFGAAQHRLGFVYTPSGTLREFLEFVLRTRAQVHCVRSQ